MCVEMALQERGEMRKKMYFVLVIDGLSLEGIQHEAGVNLITSEVTS